MLIPFTTLRKYSIKSNSYGFKVRRNLSCTVFCNSARATQRLGGAALGQWEYGLSLKPRFASDDGMARLESPARRQVSFAGSSGHSLQGSGALTKLAINGGNLLPPRKAGPDSPLCDTQTAWACGPPSGPAGWRCHPTGLSSWGGAAATQKVGPGPQMTATISDFICHPSSRRVFHITRPTQRYPGP